MEAVFLLVFRLWPLFYRTFLKGVRSIQFLFVLSNFWYNVTINVFYVICMFHYLRAVYNNHSKWYERYHRRRTKFYEIYGNFSQQFFANYFSLQNFFLVIIQVGNFFLVHYQFIFVLITLFIFGSFHVK